MLFILYVCKGVAPWLMGLTLWILFLNHCVPRLALKVRIHCSGSLTYRWVMPSTSSGIIASLALDVEIILEKTTGRSIESWVHRYYMKEKNTTGGMSLVLIWFMRNVYVSKKLVFEEIYASVINWVREKCNMLEITCCVVSRWIVGYTEGTYLLHGKG